MLHRISLAACCCDQGEPPIEPTGTLGTASLSLSSSAQVIPPSGCTFVLAGVPQDTITVFVQLFFAVPDPGRLSVTYTNADHRDLMQGEWALPGNENNPCSWNLSRSLLPNAGETGGASLSLSATQDGGGFYWRATLGFGSNYIDPLSNQSQSHTFESARFPTRLDPTQVVPLPHVSFIANPAPLPLPPQDQVFDSLWDTGLSFIAVTGSA